MKCFMRLKKVKNLAETVPPTCEVLKMTNRYRNTKSGLTMMNKPKNHVTPRIGTMTITALNPDLLVSQKKKQCTNISTSINCR